MRNLFCLSVSIFLVLFSGNPVAEIWQVMPDSSGAVINIQAGIDSCSGGDTVLVAPGIYRGDGNWDLDFKGKPIVVMSMSRFDALVTDASVIDCDDVSTHRGFHFHSGETESSILEGFEIINGGDRGLDWPEGGGILCDSSSSPTIQYNIITRCDAYNGGGIASLSSSPVIRNNEITYCYVSDSGGGIYCDEGSPRIENNYFYGNDCRNGGGGGICFWACFMFVVAGNEFEYNYSGQACSPRPDNHMPSADSSADHLPALCYSLGGGIYLCGSSGVIEDNFFTRNGAAIYARESDIEIRNNECFNNSHGAIYCWMSEVVIDNNNIHNNNATAYEAGGIMMHNSLSSTISNNIISFNSTDRYAGGIYYRGDSTSVISNNSIIGNGCGIECHSSITIAGNHIKDNHGFDQLFGGGITCASGSPRIIENVIEQNSGRLAGGIYCSSGAPVIEQNTLINNTGLAAIYCPAGSNASIQNCIIANTINGASELGSCGIYTKSPDITVSCCDLFNNGENEYIGIPDQTGINGNFSANPLFCPSEDEYYLHVLSPCSAGNHPYDNSCGLIGALGVGCDFVATLLQDYDVIFKQSAVSVSWSISEFRENHSFTLQRAQNPTWQYTTIPDPAIAGDGASFSFMDDRIVPGESYRYRVAVLDESGEQFLFETEPVNIPLLHLALHQNYPNPFNPATNIMYYLPTSGRINLNVYDVSGRLIVRLADDIQDQGHHSVEWNGLDERGNAMSSGTYFYRLTVGKETFSRKMVLLR